MLDFPPVLADAGTTQAGIVVPVVAFAMTPAEKAFSMQPAVKVFRGPFELEAAQSDTLDVLVVAEGISNTSAPAFWHAALQALHPGGRLVAKLPAGLADEKHAHEVLLLGGFVDSRVDGLCVTALRPTWKHAAALPLSKKTKKASTSSWQVVAADATLIDEDALLDDCAGGALEPGEVTLKVKKACKNCSCGLKEAEEAAVAVKLDGLNEGLAPALQAGGSGGCGSCAKGDAFRCASCPYAGLPAFTPGTKPEIGVKADGSKVLLDVADSDVVF